MTDENLNELNQEVQKSSMGELVTLYIFHLEEIDDTLPVLYLTHTQFTYKNDPGGGKQVAFAGNDYVPVDLESEGWEANAQGGLPEPSIRISLASDFDDTTSTAGVIRAAIVTWGGLVGARVERIRTLKQFLDGESDEDPDAHLPIDVYRIDRVESFNKRSITWKLSAWLDQQGTKLPRRQVLRDICSHTYRVYNPTHPDADPNGFVQRSCPYTDPTYFKRDGTSTIDPAEDNCGRRVSDCEVRFQAQDGVTNPDLPGRFFPAIGRQRRGN